MPDDYGIDDPTWHPFTVDGAMTFGQERHGNAGILTIHGIVDLMEHLTEEAEAEVRKWLEHGSRDEEAPGWLRSMLPVAAPPVDVRADVNPAYHWRADTYVVPAAGDGALLSARGDRLRAVVTNTGANPAFLSWTDDPQSLNSPGNTSWILLKNGTDPTNPRTLLCGGKIYCYSPLGTNVDIQEEYGMRFSEGGYQTP